MPLRTPAQAEYVIFTLAREKDIKCQNTVWPRLLVSCVYSRGLDWLLSTCFVHTVILCPWAIRPTDHTHAYKRGFVLVLVNASIVVA